MERIRVLIMGAAGRDFHNFNTVYRDDRRYEVVAFTATQIPGIEGRRYPKALAGEYYPDGIPIYPEEDLPVLIPKLKVDQVVFAYSDVTHEYVMHKASQVSALGADFALLGPQKTMLKSSKKVISVCAVRTGCGKSQTTRKIAQLLRADGKKVVAVRHPMPYGDLAAQAVQRFASYADLERHHCTIEEREEYESHIAQGTVVYAGVDYEAILRQAEQEADVVLWDGGNNDTPFFKSDLEIVVLDPHRAKHAELYHPGETNLLRADVLVINKIETASPEGIDELRAIIARKNKTAVVVDAASPLNVQGYEKIRGKRVLVVEDGPTLTHGEMTYGAGVIAAKKYGAAELIDPRPFAVGEIADTFRKYPGIGTLLPAMGYSERQMADLYTTIDRSDAELVIVATPIDFTTFAKEHKAKLRKDIARVEYELQEIGHPSLSDILRDRGLIG